MNKLLALLCLSMLAAPILRGAAEKTTPATTKTNPTEPTPAADSKNKPAEEPTAITVKNKSSFNIDAGARNPFWPIGWKPAARVAGANGGGGAQGEVPPGAFLVTSITLGNPNHFAIINGKTMIEGQQFGLQVGTQVYQVAVKRIEDGRVILGRGDEEIVVPLRRKEAPEHAPEGAARSASPSPSR
jgi:hypothetical protein